MFKGFSTVWLLALINAIVMSAFPMMFLIGSIIGVELAPAPQWATLPIAMMVIGTACGVFPASRTMARWGRQRGFLLFIGIGLIGIAMANSAVGVNNFTLYCAGTGVLGLSNAALQQIRFAAMESVSLDNGPTAASIIMCASIVAAFAGPELALLGKDLSTVEYQGSFWLSGACLIFGALVLVVYRPEHQIQGGEHSAGRSVRQLLREPALLLAIASAAVGFVVMSFVMTATPISMHIHNGHSLEDTKWVIQSHIAAMFLPSLATAWLFRWFSIRGLMAAGLTCYAITIAIGLVNMSVLGYWGQLVLLGIGWNFLFVSGTALLPRAYKSGEQYRAQALNDGVIFSAQAIASLSAGWAISTTSWGTIMLVCMLPVIAMTAALLRYREFLR